MQPETAPDMTEPHAQPAEQTPSEERNRLSSALRDGYEVQKAALARGLNVRLLPRQVMEVSIPGDPASTVGFTHGVPQATTLAGATYAQDLRMRRAMLLKAGFRVPRGATFSVGRSQKLGRDYAERIGFPVVLKPAVGDNTIEVKAGLKNRHQLKNAIEYLYTPSSKRKGFTRAAYALTELREPGNINGKVVAPPGYRFLVEKHVSGQYLRFLVIDGEVKSVVYCPKGPWKTRGSGMQDVFESTNQSLKDIAVSASRVVPGLAVVALDMVVPDHETETAVGGAQIVELSERPWLSVQHQYDVKLAAELAGSILSSELPQASDDQPQEHITTEVLIAGAVDPVTLLEVLSEKFSELDIEGNLYGSDHTLGEVSGTVTGAPADIAWVTQSLLDKGIGGQRAMLASQQPAD